MNGDIARLDPSFPLCWETRDTLRIGFEEAITRIEQPEPGVQRLVSALRDGVRIAGIEAMMRRFGVTGGQFRETLTAVAPALLSQTTGAESATVGAAALAVAGSGVVADALRNGLAESGHLVAGDAEAHGPTGTGDVDLFVLVEHYLAPIDHFTQSLFEERPVLIVQLRDRSIRIGPLSAPGASPCATCATHHAIDADPALPVLAAQLLGRRAATDVHGVAPLLTALVSDEISRWRLGAPALAAATLRVDVEHGIPLPGIERSPLEAHRACACRSPASEMNLDGRLPREEPPELPETSRRSRALVRAT